MKKNEISRRDFLKGASAGAAALAVMELLPVSALAQEDSAEASGQADTESTAEQAAEVSALDKEIYCVDRFVTKPGQGKEFLDYFMEVYKEKAESYGMLWKSTMVSPPLWLDNASNTIEITWAIAGFNGWAAMVNSCRYESGTADLWRDIRTRVVSQDRSYYALEEDMEVLNNV